MATSDLRRSMPADGGLVCETMPDGWKLRVFDWPATTLHATRGSILWLGGRGDFVEKYLESFAHWHERGWHVTSFDWRGQGGSGRLLADPGVGHIDDFATWVRDLAAFWSRWTARTSPPHIVMGHSMGGHLVLGALAERRIDPAAAVLVAPMLGFEAGPLPQPIAAPIARLLGRVLGKRSAWKSNERPARRTASRQAFLTSDISRYDDELWWKVQQSSLALGPPSWGWMAAAYRSFAVLDDPGSVARVDVPVLVLGTDGDQLVSPNAIRATAARLTRGELHMWDAGLAHEILRERDAVRDDALGRIDVFLEAQVPK